MKFIALAPLNFSESGGARALYELTRTLRKLDYEAYIYPMSGIVLPPHFEAMEIAGCPVIPQSMIDLDYDIAIYPEIVQGNPFGTKRCVRWILFPPGIHSADHTPTWGDNDLYMYFSGFSDERYSNLSIDDMLFVLGLDEQMTYNKREERQLNLIITRKGAHVLKELKQFHPDGALHLDKICKTRDDYINYFRKGKYLYCYDPFTFHVQLAALSGCLPIVHPVPGLSRAEWINAGLAPWLFPKINGEPFMPGVVYANSEDLEKDIKIAKDTAHLLWPILKKIRLEGEKTVDRFAKRAMVHFSGSHVEL